MTRDMTIDGRRIDDAGDCYVIAEIGHNHQGSLEKARDLFRAAAECGADAVKLQKRCNRELFTRSMYESPYESENSYGATYGEHREALEFGLEEYVELQAYARELGVAMFATPFDVHSADFLAELDVPAFKIASADLTNTPLLAHVARLGRPMIVSTGGGTLEDVRRAYDTVLPLNSNLCVMQCTASYPADPEDMNLRVVDTYRRELPDAVIGLSDHHNGIVMGPIAYTLGARMIEKHFTLNRTWRGTDHAFSQEPTGLRKLVRDLRRTRVALGDGEKRQLECERKPLWKMAKALVAARDLPAGHVLAAADVAIRSPADGLPPYEIDRLIGGTLLEPLAIDEAFRLEDVAEETRLAG